MIFTKEATPEQGQNVWGAPTVVACLDRTSFACGYAEDDHRIEFSVRSIEVVAAVDRARRVQLIELAVCGRCPAKLSFLPAVTGHKWRENAPPPQSPQKMGVVDIARIPKAWPSRFDFGEEGITWFSDFFIPFYHEFFEGDCSKFCVIKMKSTVRSPFFFELIAKLTVTISCTQSKSLCMAMVIEQRVLRPASPASWPIDWSVD